MSVSLPSFLEELARIDKPPEVVGQGGEGVLVGAENVLDEVLVGDASLAQVRVCSLPSLHREKQQGAKRNSHVHDTMGLD